MLRASTLRERRKSLSARACNILSPETIRQFFLTRKTHPLKEKRTYTKILNHTNI